MNNVSIFIGSDNAIILNGLADSATQGYINDGTLSFTLYRQRTEDAAMTAGSAVLTSESAVFSSDDVGRHVVVPGAGQFGSDLRTTVSAYTSATSVTLAASAQTAVAYARTLISLPNAAGVAMSYVSGSNGRYRGILDSSVPLGVGGYVLAVSISGGAGRDDFRQIEIAAMYRQLKAEH